MEQSQREALINAVESAYAEAGFNLYSGAAVFRSLVEEFYPLIVAAQTREGLHAFFADCDPLQEEKAMDLVQLALRFPSLARQFATDTIRERAKTLPPAAPGRKPELTPEQKREVVDYVVRLYRSGVSMTNAHLRAARHFGISRRTSQRAWSDRANADNPPIATLADAVRVLTQSSPPAPTPPASASAHAHGSLARRTPRR